MKKTEVNATLLKNVNRKKILSVIDDIGSVSRVEIKNILGKNGKTVTNITNSLIDDGLVTSIGYSSFTGGRRRELLTTNPDFGYLIGIDLEVHFLKVVLTDFRYKILVEEKIPVIKDESKDVLLSKIDKAITYLITKSKIKIDKLLGIGFVANGFYNYKTGYWIFSANNRNWKDVPIKDFLTSRYNVPIYIENNTRSKALAEKHFGVAKDSNNFVYIDWGAGIGGAIINNNGRIYRGIKNLAGEVGHINVIPNGDLCSCGNNGCLETVAAGWAIEKITKEKIASGVTSEISKLCKEDLEELNTDMIFEAFNNGDDLAKEVLDNANEYLGPNIANLVSILNPELIVLGGFFASLNDSFITSIKEKIRKYAMTSLIEDLKIEVAEVKNNSAVLGAVTLVRDSYFYIDAIK